jgi:hypothetical protein
MKVPPNKVINWLATTGFRPLKVDSLGDAFQILDKVTPESPSFLYHPHGVPDMVATITVPKFVLEWYRTEGAEAELAQLYLHGSKG